MLIKIARGLEECQAGPNSDALQLLERFVDDFEGLHPDKIQTPQQWKVGVPNIELAFIQTCTTLNASITSRCKYLRN